METQLMISRLNPDLSLWTCRLSPVTLREAAREKSQDLHMAHARGIKP